MMPPDSGQRPPLTQELTGEELLRWYWLRDELVQFARGLGIRTTGGKELLTRRIAAHLDGVSFDMTTMEETPRGTGRDMRETPDEWEIDRLDLDAYLRRIGYEGPLEPVESVLQALHHAHAVTIPFENLDIVMGRGISLALDDIQDKLVRRNRGGYCYEHNLLFAAVLERIGFEVRRLVARVNPDKPGPRTHMTLDVSDGYRAWLADVGFGANLLGPVPLQDGAVVRDGAWTNTVTHRDGGTWRLRAKEGDGWKDLYGFTREPQHANDYRVCNHYVSTHPASPFVDRIVAIRITPDARYTLRDRTRVIVRPGDEPAEQAIAGDDLPAVLRETFGIELMPEEIALLHAAPKERPAR